MRGYFGLKGGGMCLLVQDMVDVPLAAMVVLPVHTSPSEALKILDANGESVGVVVDKKGCLLGKVRRDLLLSESDHENLRPFLEPVENIVRTFENATVLVSSFRDGRRKKVYVVDEDGNLVGAVSSRNNGLNTLVKASSLLPIPDIFDAMHDAIIVIDETGTIVYANHAYSRIIGVQVGKILGKRMQTVEPTSPCLGVLNGDPPILNRCIRIQSLGIEVIASITPIYQGQKKVGVISVFRSIDETLRLSIELQRLKNAASNLQRKSKRERKLPPAFAHFVGKNKRFLDTLALAAKVAPTGATVMIRGENGVGKEILAKAIHNSSPRSSRPLVKVNCAAIPEQLLESELFGYEEGAFTGAKKGGRIGKFESAHKGTLFLDEVGDMSLAMQAKLLRAIQEKEIEKIGSNRVVQVDVRIISATNKDLEAMVAQKRFREDLYYRLNVMPIMIPPLRERKDDIPLLAEHFMKQYCSELGRKEIVISSEVMEIFIAYRWPGNIRELQNAVEHGVILCTDGVMTPEHLPWYLQKVSSRVQVSQPSGVTALRKLVAQVEKEAIVEALRMCNNNKSAAIKALGISRRTFYEKMKKYRIR